MSQRHDVAHFLAAAAHIPRCKRPKPCPKSSSFLPSIIDSIFMRTPSSTQRRSPNVNQALEFLVYLSENCSVEVWEDFLQIMKGFKLGRLDVHDVAAYTENVFGKEVDLIRRFNNFLPEGLEIDIEPATVAAADVCFEDGVDFIRRVKARFADNDIVYKSFIKIIRMYRSQKSASDVESMVRELLQNFPDIYEEFLRYLPDGSDMGDEGFSSGNTDRRNYSRENRKLLSMPNAQNESEGRGGEHKRQRSQRIANYVAVRLSQHGKASVSCNFEVSSSSAKRMPKRNISRRIELPEDEKGKPLETVERRKDGKNQTVKDKEREQLERGIPCPLEKTASNLFDLNQAPAGERINSIRALNDIPVISKASDNEEYCNLSQPEKILMQCEDDRFELDMVISRVKATIKQMEKFLKKVYKEPAQVRVKYRLNALSLRCIERLYGEQYLLVMEALHNDPRLVLPVLIRRLRMKLEEWLSSYPDFDRILTEVVRTNYYKAV